MTRFFLPVLFMVLTGTLYVAMPLRAQEMAIPANVSPEMRQKIMEAQKARQAGRAKPPAGVVEQKKDDKSKEKDADKKPADDKKAEAKPSTVQRGDKPTKEPDPEELKVRPVDGLISFQFQGQPWPAVIEWYGTISGQTIDWRELPSDYLNIRTQQAFTLDQTRDALNRHLLARGFTMLEDGEFLSIEKTEGINTALVPRIAPVELVNLMPHSFVKTSFRLSRIMAEEAVKELESMKSKNGKLTALVATNRIEAMDAVENLRQIHEVLEQEQDVGRRTLQEFPLDHVRAVDVRTKLEELLGIEKKQTNAPMSPQQMQQMQRMQQQMQQQNKGQPPQAAKKDEPAISFVVNERRNSIIAQAPPNKMFIINEAIELLDVPSNRGDSLESYLGRIRTYRLETLDAEEVVNILFETGGLDPSTTLRVDKDSKAIIASAPPWDHLIIEKLVDKLDGSARHLKVVRLRRRQADQVATTIETLMVGTKEEDNNSRRRYYYPWNQQEEEDDDEFRVGADIEHNWLLLWCNEHEHEEVMALLQELGEIPMRYRGSDQIRVIEALPGEDQDAFLRRVRRAFEEIAPNPIELPETIIEPKSDAAPPTSSPAKEARQESDDSAGESSDTRTVNDRPRWRTTLTQIRREAPVAGDPAPRFRRSQSNNPAPIRVERDAQGRLVIRSQDTAALDLFEELVERMAPRKRDYTVFTLEYASATWVALKLEDFFEEEEENNNSRFPFFFIYDYGAEEDKRAGLGDRRKIRFISEIDTNTILVRNATEDQLATIRDLIEIYDIPEPVSTQNARFTKTFKVSYAKARNIETTLKDVFRDLLSGNDKAFQQQNQDKDNPSRTRNRGSSFFGGFGNDDDISASSPKAAFKGKLSFGVDEAANILIVTTEGEKLMEIVESMIKELDNAAMPTDDVRVVTLPGNTSSESMRDMLERMFGPERVGRGNGQNGQNGQNEENGRNGNQNPNQNPNGERPAAAVRAR